MDHMLKHTRKEMKLEGLQIELDLLEALQARHMLWINDDLDPALKRLHCEIIELIHQTQEKYTILLDNYNLQSHE